MVIEFDTTLVPHSINSTVHANRTFDGDAVHGELLTFANRDATKSEFSVDPISSFYYRTAYPAVASGVTAARRSPSASCCERVGRS